MSKPKLQSATVFPFYMSDDMKTQLQTIADDEDRSVASIVRKFISEGLVKRNKPQDSK